MAVLREISEGTPVKISIYPPDIDTQGLFDTIELFDNIDWSFSLGTKREEPKQIQTAEKGMDTTTMLILGVVVVLMLMMFMKK